MSGNCYLGIDTSNYKTSVAVVDDEGNNEEIGRASCRERV